MSGIFFKTGLVVAGLVIAQLHTPSHAQGVDLGQRRTQFTPGELSLLPPYCDTKHRDAKWNSVIGSDIRHMHHYCRGLRDMNYARMTPLPANQRNFLWERSITEFTYMIRRSRPDMVLMPEVYVKMGEAHLHLNQFIDAEAAFSNARNLKPDYATAYVLPAEKLIDLKLYTRARDLLETGLRHAPNDKSIQAQLARLPKGGEPSSPPPEKTGDLASPTPEN